MTTLSYLREFEHVTLARALMRRYQEQPGRTLHSLRHLDYWSVSWKAAEEGEGWEASSKSWYLQRRSPHQAQGDISAALMLCNQALVAGPSQGPMIRLFVNEGKPMAQLLSEATAHGIMPDYIGKVAGCIEAEGAEERRQI